MMDGAAHPRGTGGLLPPQAPSKAKQTLLIGTFVGAFSIKGYFAL